MPGSCEEGLGAYYALCCLHLLGNRMQDKWQDPLGVCALQLPDHQQNLIIGFVNPYKKHSQGTHTHFGSGP